jgi:rRNA maturation RNase YbeY
VKLVISSRSRVKGKAEFERASSAMIEIAHGAFPGDATVEVNLIGERRMAALNRAYRKGSGVSSVLTFSYTGEGEPKPGEEGTLGEIYLCWKPLISEARRRRVSRRTYLLRLFVHGLCHLRGFRHGDPESEKRMEDTERALLKAHVSAAELARLFA